MPMTKSEIQAEERNDVRTDDDRQYVCFDCGATGHTGDHPQD